ncbi:MFS general substrate transporter [Lichtheimia hyalospora FSU 10163]|nr:MFS general substrate transporter [Lichtheimia hyalospora FSU 10163]
MYTLCKLLYITVFGLLSAAPPYLPLYYRNVLGFSSDQIGFAIAIAPFVQSISCPVWTYFVDKYPRLHGATMAFTSCLGGIAVMGIMGIGHYVQSSITTDQEQDNKRGIVIATCTFALAFAFFTLPNTALVDSAVMKILGPNKILYGEQRLWGSVSTGLTILLVGILISATDNLDMLFWVFAASTVGFMVCSAITNVEESSTLDEEQQRLLDDNMPAMTSTNSRHVHHLHHPTTLYQSLSRHDTDDDDDHLSYTTALETYQQQRLFKLTTTTSIISMARTLREEANDALDCCSSSINNNNLGLAVSRVMSVEHTAGIMAEDSDSVQMPSTSTFRSPRVFGYLITTLLFGVVLSIIVNFLFLFLSDNLHMPASWIGWTGPLGGLTELFSFFYSKQMMERWGVTKLVVFAHLVTIVRCLGYTWLVPDSVVSHILALALQTLHGIGFAIFWGTSVSEMDSFFPPEQRAVAQGVLGSLHQGLGTALGALLGGYLDEYLGTIWMFRCAAALCGVSIFIFCISRLPRFEN